jgi:ribonucleoside-diphosphate reductase alpha chain
MRSNFLVVNGGKNGSGKNGAGKNAEVAAVATASAVESSMAVGATGAGAVETVTAKTFAMDQNAIQRADGHMDDVREARMKGYEGDACGECGNFTLVRNGTCMKCVTCGATSGCS